MANTTRAGPSSKNAAETFTSSSNIMYSFVRSDKKAYNYVREGLDATDIMFLSCEEEAMYNKFRVRVLDTRPITIDVFPAGMDPSCTCGANTNMHACRHIFWLEDKAVRAFMTRNPPLVQPLKLDDRGRKIGEYYPHMLISQVGVAEFERLSSEPQVGHEERARAVSDILSVFEPSGALPDEFYNNSYDMIDRKSTHYQILRQIITRLLMNNDAEFMRLQEALPPGFRALVLFEKLGSRAHRAFKAFDEYVERGVDTEKPAMDVASCAKELEEVVAMIKANLARGMGDGVDFQDAESKAAGALVEILEGVANSHDRWLQPQPQKPPYERNLYLYLFGKRSADGQFFTLDALQQLNDKELRKHKGKLEELRAKIEAHGGAHQEYVARLRDIISG